MSLDIALLVLRISSGVALLVFLGLLFAFIWRDYRAVAQQLAANKRVYGQLVPLVEVDGDYAVVGESYPLLPLTSLGRSPTNSVVIHDEFASGEHALVALRSGQWWLEDRQSRNGTTINGLPITQPVVITHGDIIGIGNLRLRLDLEQSA